MFSSASTLLIHTLTYGLLFVFACAICLWLYAEPHAGHKRDLMAGVVFSAVSAISFLLYAWQQVEVRESIIPQIIHWMASTIAMSLIFYAVARYSHVVITLIRSEWINRIVQNKSEDGHMENLLLPYAAESLRHGLEAIQARYLQRGIRWRAQQPVDSSLRP